MKAEWRVIVPVPIAAAEDPEAVEQTRVHAECQAVKVGAVLTGEHKVRYNSVLRDLDGEVLLDLGELGLAALVFEGNL